MAFTPAQLNLPPGLPFERINSFKVLNSTQRPGRSIRRAVTTRQLKTYKLQFLGVACVESATPTEAILSVFPTPFDLITPDDGTLTVRFINDTLDVIQINPSLFNFTIEAQEIF